MVSFGIFYPGGRLDETPENAGITELMLRSALMGTRRYNGAAIARRLENAGASVDLVNEPDFFGYILDGLEGSMSDALGVLMDVLNDPTFPEVQVDRQRALQMARLVRMRDDAYAHAVHEFTRLLLHPHPYAWPAEGRDASVDALRAEDVRSWYREQQRGVMPVIVIVGATRGSSLVSTIADALTNEDLFERDIREQVPAEPAPESREVVLETDRRQSALVFGAPGPSLSGEDAAALTVLGHVMSGLGGRLFDAIRDEAGLAYSVRTLDDFRALSGAFLTYTAFSPANEAEVRALLEEEIRALIEGGVPEDELERARNSAIGRRESGMQTRRERVLEYTRWIISGNGVDAAREYSERLAGVDAEGIRAAARQYLDPESATVLVLRGRD
jgi:zinc protease